VIIGDSPLDLEDFSKKLEGYYDWWTTNREYSMKTYEELIGEVDAVSAERLSLVDPDVFELWIEGCTDPSAFRRLFHGYDVTELLNSISCPVMLLQSNENTLPDRDVEYATSVSPHITHVKLKNHGHYLGLDTGDTGELKNALTSFLESLK
jgi:pimeloyl-ACP methyl ester carboxylesterase